MRRVRLVYGSLEMLSTHKVVEYTVRNDTLAPTCTRGTHYPCVGALGGSYPKPTPTSASDNRTFSWEGKQCERPSNASSTRSWTFIAVHDRVHCMGRGWSVFKVTPITGERRRANKKGARVRSSGRRVFVGALADVFEEAPIIDDSCFPQGVDCSRGLPHCHRTYSVRS